MDTRVPFVILVLALFICIESVTVVNGAKPHVFQNSRLDGTEYCDFSRSQRMYNITDLLLCMNDLASTAVPHSRNARSSNGMSTPLVSSRRTRDTYPRYQQPQYNYPPRPGGDYHNSYDRRPSLYYPGSGSSQGDNSGFYDGGTRYPYQSETPFGFSGGAGAGLFNALTSISQYDDLKCVPRLLCEVATGVIPGNSGYKQSYDDFGGNPLIRLLTALDIGGSSPLLTFGKSALTGYTNRGNPDICYREYPKCPRSNAELVNYLNNHNGGFFRFFGKNRGQRSQSIQGNYYRGALKREPAPPPGLSITEGGEQKEFNKVVFPQEPMQEEPSLNRVSKSLSGYQENGNGYQNPLFFPQDRKDQEANMLYGSSSSVNTLQDQPRAHSFQTMGLSKARLYLPEDPSNETMSTFTFPDGQKVQINVAFSKLFSEGYKKALRRSFANDHGPQPINFDGFSMVNLAELYPNDRRRPDLRVVHPCDMICHDLKGTPVQFNQILLHSGSLSTLMAPDQPILDLSVPLQCEVMCIDRRGERTRISTTLNQVLRISYDHSNQPDFMGLQDHLENREYQWLNHQQRRMNLHKREVIAPIQRTKQFSLNEYGNQPSSSTDKSQQQVPTVEEHRKDHQFGSVPRDRRGTRQLQRKLYVPKSRNTGKRENNADAFKLNDKAASTPEESIMIASNQMPFYGPPVPFMGLGEMSQGGPAFLPHGVSDPFGLTMPSMQGLPMTPDGGIIESFGMLSMFPGMMPMIDRLSTGLASMIPLSQPSTIGCSGPGCSPVSQSPTRALKMCGSILYFIPPEIFGTMPICAVPLDSDEGSSGGHGPQQTPSPEFTTTPLTVDLPGRSDITMPSENFQAISVSTTPKFRQPEGEDYPQVSCLEGESWNLDVHECVPIKYDRDFERAYTHLPGSPWSGITQKPMRSHKLKKRKKLVIITDKGNITYIKAA